ncbi:3-beta hydroxysteroid dehydrogenase/isomerase family-domain-containing protein [Dunaliella salina]|uniref:3-beta hydroxysteroid dehydrogenase/isomerase family-domain-containing protein n=1 Tax=Dunaliella salina TaxID=3046 RepID=A0ABQ7GHB1_DUNSA|nr:3-beta hydroxysteroid dehydrogenase/isomerase family-domain-containing protein [Dunaliella salina]|eukprot:KAF5833988.1 3-beta hydroxysteroid dehydrogenase/isomerase family-domain-containing protein [Dunaliella salina]
MHKLAEEGRYQAVLFDIRPPAEQTPGVQVVTGDVRDEDAVRAACQGCDVVFHVASFGMTGDEALDRQRVYQVNVQGTQNVLRACQAQGVGRLVYVSSYNAVFDGSHPIYGADEQSARVIDYTQTSCPYTATKAQAEQMVLGADRAQLQDASASPPRSEGCEIFEARLLRTCVIRPAGIYGPGEQRHTMRILRLKRLGIVRFTFGDPGSLVDFIHCDNLCQGMIKAAEGLSEEKNAIAGGQVYFMSDGSPVNNFKHWQGIVTGAGYSWPNLRLPFLLVYYAGAFMELACLAARLAGIPLTPLLSRTEVNKCGVTHYFKIDKARKELGYDPQSYDLVEIGAWYKEHGYGPAAESELQWSRLRLPRPLLLCLVVLVAVAVAIFCLF